MQKENPWLVPAKVMDIDENGVWIAGNGDLKKVLKCYVKLSTKKNDVSFKIVKRRE